MYALHAVVIDKKVPKLKAKTMAKDIIKNPNHTFMRETTTSYRFRNLPKTDFDPKSYRSKVINENVTLIFGRLKK